MRERASDLGDGPGPGDPRRHQGRGRGLSEEQPRRRAGGRSRCGPEDGGGGGVPFLGLDPPRRARLREGPRGEGRGVLRLHHLGDPAAQDERRQGLGLDLASAGEDRQRARLPLLLPSGLHRAGAGHRPPGPKRVDPPGLAVHRKDLHRRWRAGDPEVMRRAFTLLEVVVALAILGLALLAIFDLNSGAVASHAYAKRITVATMLARSKMTDIEQELYDKGFDADDREIQGDFRTEGWEAYTWKAQILAPRTTEISPDKLIEMLFNLPPGKDGVSGLAALLGGGRDGGVASALSNISGSGGALAQQL